MRLIIFLVVLLVSNTTFSQNKYGNIWVNGYLRYFKTDFNSSVPVNSYMGHKLNICLWMGQSNICDSNGKLILFSNGLDIFDSLGYPIDGGGNIVPSMYYNYCAPGATSPQTSLFLPAGNDLYHFLTPIISDNEEINLQNPNYSPKGRDLLLYNLIDMNANNGAGKVIKRMIPILENGHMAITNMMACRHGDGKSWWLLKQAWDTNMVYKFLITKDSVFGPYNQGFAQPMIGKGINGWGFGGQSVFSQDGKLYASLSYRIYKLLVNDFDRCSGSLSNLRIYDVPVPSIYDDSSHVTYPSADSLIEGIAFSPSGRFLYISKYFSILQFDLWDSNLNTAWDTIAYRDTSWLQFAGYSTLYLGPDNKIYIGNLNAISGQMSVINYPDKKGDSCGFCKRCLRFNDPNAIAITSPPNMANYNLGPSNPICWPAVVEEVPPQEEINVYPNPFEATLIIKCSHVQNITFYLYDSFGKLILTKTFNENKEQINTTNLSAGLYFYSIVNKNGERVKAGKVVKE